MKKGFTLIELAIVLVIIGLIIGGILVARSMVGTSKISAQVRQFGQFDAAVANFITKYNSIPGDSKALNSSSFGSGYIEDGGTTCCGVGSGFFAANIANFWVQLGQSGFTQNDATFTATIPAAGFDITSTTRNSPVAAIDPKTGIIAASIPNYNGSISISFYGLADFSALNDPSLIIAFVDAPSITPEQAAAIDTKMDDGIATSGIVLATANQTSGSDRFGLNPPSGACASSGAYLVNSNARACIPMVQIMSGSGGMSGRGTSY